MVTRLTPVYINYKKGEDLPDTLLPDHLYICTHKDDEAFMVTLLCPCGCARPLHMRTYPGHWLWDNGTLTPSVNSCRCSAHFHITDWHIQHV